MKFIIAESPNPTLWPAGKVLTFRKAAQLLRMDAADMALLCHTATHVRDQGFCLEVRKDARDESQDTH